MSEFTELNVWVYGTAPHLPTSSSRIYLNPVRIIKFPWCNITKKKKKKKQNKKKQKTKTKHYKNIYLKNGE